MTTSSERGLWEHLGDWFAQGLTPDALNEAMLAWLEAAQGHGGLVLAVRERATLPWSVTPAAGELAGALGSHPLAPAGGVAPYAAQRARYLAISLPLSAPLQGVLLVPEGRDVQGLKPLLPAIAMAASHGLMARQNERHEATVEQLARTLRALQQVSHQINNSYDLKALSASICSVATTALGAQYAGLLHLVDGRLQVIEDLAVVRSQGLGLLKMLQDANAREALAPMPLEAAGFLREVVETGRSMRVPDLGLAPGLMPEAIKEHGLRSLMATPLVTQREVLGVFVVGSLSRDAFAERDQELLAELAQQATGAFVTSKLYGQTVEEKRRADAMVERLKNLNLALAAIGRNLGVTAACDALIAFLPRFAPVRDVAVYLEREEGWEWVAGSQSAKRGMPGEFSLALAQAACPPSLNLDGTDIWLFSLTRHQEPVGAVVFRCELGLEPTAREAIETLVGHTALTLANAVMLEQVEQQAITDGLTGVFNRRYFNERLEIELQRSGRYAHSVSLIILDIDFFKRANDVLGHLGGDMVLKELANLLKEKVRKIDIVARYGGEEFAIILPETAQEAGCYVAEKIRGWIEEFPFTDQDKLPHRVITASLGVASFPDNADSLEALIQLADAALYRAKQAGRNQVGKLEPAATMPS